MSIRDYNKVYYVRNQLTNKCKAIIPHADLFDDTRLNFNISVGDYLLLKYVKDILKEESDCLLTCGYKE